MSITLEEFQNESWFKITNYDSLRPFFISVVSDSNHWMFISTNGGLTAGRKNAEFALFPYYTDDKLTELAHTTGSKSIFQVKTSEGLRIWEPFSDRNTGDYNLSRNLYKNRHGNKIMFEEVNHDLGLTYSYQWNSSNLFGFVRKSNLRNNSSSDVEVNILDGIQNIMPHGVSSDLQTRVSNLVDAYKRSELHKESGLGIFALSAIIVDKAEPSEALKANVAWSTGFDNPSYLLSSLQLDQFRSGNNVTEEQDVKGEKGAYFLNKTISLTAGSDKVWMIVANVNQNQSGIHALIQAIDSDAHIEKTVADDVDNGTAKLIKLISAADGIQQSADVLSDSRHYSNVLFNIMRGGIFDENYQIEKEDFTKYLSTANKSVVQNNQAFINSLSNTFTKNDLDEKLESVDDADLLRLGTEYLPLKFSRRHGDPSRPWNKFSINTHNEIDGSKILDYEGNWRDIFQNWEALAHSYPEFMEGMIFKFLNASTFDGYNPYRVTKDGFDWEIIEPDDPWSYIGYWGDHQIIYLLKFLEFYYNHKPEAFKQLFSQDTFVYANVPYRIKSYEDICRDPKDTIEFDHESDHKIREQVKQRGGDGALLGNPASDIHRVNFIEKILATVLSKVSNFIPEGGIWLNTQRPEWNDANNALVGNGVSMVTLYYLRRFLKFFEPIIEESSESSVEVSSELSGFFNRITTSLNEHLDKTSASIDDAGRKAVTDALGKAGSDFRNQIYDNGFDGSKSELQLSEISSFLKNALQFLEHSIRANKRSDDLYHAYNIMSYHDDGIQIEYLDEMLEGQVAVLSSGYLNAEESLSVLNALRNSALYREDQFSYILYPNKELKGFLQRNNIPENSVKKSKLLQSLLNDGNLQILNRDIKGGFHFNGNFKNAGDLKLALDEMKESKYGDLIASEESMILEIFEEVFNHKAFTGRSGTFYGYEGLGSIYWHMVSKLNVAVMESYFNAESEGANKATLDGLAKHFYEVEAGIGVHKDPELYGAFPTDPYSHTPFHRGAQQPGMTGQVKEDILVRFGELGISVEDGQLVFDPSLLKSEEFSDASTNFEYVNTLQKVEKIALPEKSLGFLCCQVPVCYFKSDNASIEVELIDGNVKTWDGNKLDAITTSEIFNRSGLVKQINVGIPESNLR